MAEGGDTSKDQVRLKVQNSVKIDINITYFYFIRFTYSFLLQQYKMPALTTYDYLVQIFFCVVDMSEKRENLHSN